MHDLIQQSECAMAWYWLANLLILVLSTLPCRALLLGYSVLIEEKWVAVITEAATVNAREVNHATFEIGWNLAN